MGATLKSVFTSFRPPYRFARFQGPAGSTVAVTVTRPAGETFNVPPALPVEELGDIIGQRLPEPISASFGVTNPPQIGRDLAVSISALWGPSSISYLSGPSVGGERFEITALENGVRASLLLTQQEETLLGRLTFELDRPEDQNNPNGWEMLRHGAELFLRPLVEKRFLNLKDKEEAPSTLVFGVPELLYDGKSARWRWSWEEEISNPQGQKESILSLALRFVELGQAANKMTLQETCADDGRTETSEFQGLKQGIKSLEDCIVSAGLNPTSLQDELLELYRQFVDGEAVRQLKDGPEAAAVVQNCLCGLFTQEKLASIALFQLSVIRNRLLECSRVTGRGLGYVPLGKDEQKPGDGAIQTACIEMGWLYSHLNELTEALAHQYSIPRPLIAGSGDGWTVVPSVASLLQGMDVSTLLRVIKRLRECVGKMTKQRPWK